MQIIILHFVALQMTVWSIIMASSSVLTTMTMIHPQLIVHLIDYEDGGTTIVTTLT